MTRRLAESSAKGNPEVLRQYSLKLAEKEYNVRMLRQLNAELSPFKDDETKDS